MNELENAEMSPTHRLFVSSVTFEQLCTKSHHEDSCMRQNNLAEDEELDARPLTYGGAALLDRAPALQIPQPMTEQRPVPPTKATTTPLTRAQILPRTAARADLVLICGTDPHVDMPSGGTSEYCTQRNFSAENTGYKTMAVSRKLCRFT